VTPTRGLGRTTRGRGGYAERAMTTPPNDHDHQAAQEPRERTFDDVLRARTHRRRERIYQQIKRNRQGGHKIPTWVLAVALALILAGWAYLIIFD
jgi:hypothetical protein